MAIDDSSCMATPDKRLPSVSCSARPMTAVSTAEVVMIERKLTPDRDSSITIATADAIVTDRSRRILGMRKRRPARSKSTRPAVPVMPQASATSAPRCAVL